MQPRCKQFEKEMSVGQRLTVRWKVKMKRVIHLQQCAAGRQVVKYRRLQHKQACWMLEQANHCKPVLPNIGSLVLT